jgi:hypothetical protein
MVTVLLDNRSLEFVHNIDVDLFTVAGENLQVRLHVDTHPPETTSRLLAVLPTRFNDVMDGVRTRLTFTDAAGNHWMVEYGHPVCVL